MKSLLLALPLLLLPLTAAHATPSADAAFLHTLAAPAACATAAATLPELQPAPRQRTGAGCNAGFCQTNDDCPCDTSPGTCSGGVCQYGSPGGGGPGGGGGTSCPAALCFLDSQCVSNCKDAPNSYCSGGLCVYVP